MAKIKMVIKNTFAVSVITNLLLIDQYLKRIPKYPRCPVCGKATFLHHDYKYYSNYRCCDKKCNHSMFVPKPNNILPASMSKLVGKTDFKRMRYPVHIIITALSMFYLGKNSFRNIALILRVLIMLRSLILLLAIGVKSLLLFLIIFLWNLFQC